MSEHTIEVLEGLKELIQGEARKLTAKIQNNEIYSTLRVDYQGQRAFAKYVLTELERLIKLEEAK